MGGVCDVQGGVDVMLGGELGDLEIGEMEI